MCTLAAPCLGRDVGVAVVGYGVISSSGAFGVTAAFLVGLLGAYGTAVLDYGGIVALRRETSAPTAI